MGGAVLHYIGMQVELHTVETRVGLHLGQCDLDVHWLLSPVKEV